MGSKRPIEIADRFVAYDPQKKTCNVADRNLIKRLAGKQGSETKKRRLQQEKAAKSASFSPVTASRKSARLTAGGGQRPSTYASPSVSTPYHTVPPAVQSPPINRDLLFPQHRVDNLWLPTAPGWQSPASHASSTLSHSIHDPVNTPSNSPRNTLDLTPGPPTQPYDSFHDYFSAGNEFAYDSLPHTDFQPAGQAHHAAMDARAFGSFDSGFQEADSFDFDFASFERSQPTSHGIFPKAARLNTPASTHQSDHGEVDIDGCRRASNVKHDPVPYPDGTSMHSSAMKRSYSPFSANNQGAEAAFSNAIQVPGEGDIHSTAPQYPCAEESTWPLVDKAVVSWVHRMEGLGRLHAGSAVACLDVLSNCEEARLLWQLNLSRINPRTVLCPRSPHDIYAQAKARMKQMTPGQRLDVEGLMIRIGLAEYAAISLVMEVSSLRRDIGTRRDLNVSSRAEALVDYRLHGLGSGTQSIVNHLWPEMADAA